VANRGGSKHQDEGGEGTRLHKRVARGRWGGYPGIEAQPILVRARGEHPLVPSWHSNFVLIPDTPITRQFKRHGVAFSVMQYRFGTSRRRVQQV